MLWLFSIPGEPKKKCRTRRSRSSMNFMQTWGLLSSPTMTPCGPFVQRSRSHPTYFKRPTQLANPTLEIWLFVRIESSFVCSRMYSISNPWKKRLQNSFSASRAVGSPIPMYSSVWSAAKPYISWCIAETALCKVSGSSYQDTWASSFFEKSPK